MTLDKFSHPLPKDKLDELISKLDKLLSFARIPPQRIYHYTTVEGAKGILETDQLWVSNAQFLNDSFEVTLGLNKILRIISARRRAIGATNPQGTAFLESLARASKELFSRAFDVHVACFSERPDILSQWRNYGAGCIALGFSLDALHALQSRPPAFPAYPILAKVDYSNDHQNAKVRQVLDLILSYLAYVTPGSVPTGTWGNPFEIASNVLFGLIPSFKHQSFSEEREWRLIKYLPKQVPSELQEVCFRTTRYGLTPYFHLHSHSGKLPLEEIHYGPSPYIENGVQSLRMIVQKKGYAVRSVKFDTPFRL